ncbi:hypothetical protein DFH27DRAFT_485387, partial [Peziza echinospora]
RVLVVTLRANRYKNSKITEQTGVPLCTEQNIYKKAKERGYNQPKSKVVHNYQVEDGKSNSRPPVLDEIKREVEEQVVRGRAGREKSFFNLMTKECQWKLLYICRILKASGFNKTKPTYDPGLTIKMKTTCLQFCLVH